jgi:hypothetical protein
MPTLLNDTNCLQRKLSADGQGHKVFSVLTGGRAPSFSRLVYGGNRSPEPFDVAHGPDPIHFQYFMLSLVYPASNTAHRKHPLLLPNGH